MPNERSWRAEHCVCCSICNVPKIGAVSIAWLATIANAATDTMPACKWQVTMEGEGGGGGAPKSAGNQLQCPNSDVKLPQQICCSAQTVTLICHNKFGWRQKAIHAIKCSWKHDVKVTTLFWKLVSGHLMGQSLAPWARLWGLQGQPYGSMHGQCSVRGGQTAVTDITGLPGLPGPRKCFFFQFFYNTRHVRIWAKLAKRFTRYGQNCVGALKKSEKPDITGLPGLPGPRKYVFFNFFTTLDMFEYEHNWPNGSQNMAKTVLGP